MKSSTYWIIGGFSHGTILARKLLNYILNHGEMVYIALKQVGEIASYGKGQFVAGEKS